MMTAEARATAILRDAETNLRQLAGEAASAGDYAGIIKVAAWAKAISDLIKSTAPGIDSKPMDGLRKQGRKAKTAEPRSPARQTRPKDYPRFCRQGDQLIRIAWSKREKKEYQHKASELVIKALTTALTKAGKGGRIFSTEEVLPIHEPGDGSEIPNYQAYVGIAWLKHTGLIDQHGRQGYSVPRLDDLQRDVESLWQSLPNNNGQRGRKDD